MADDTRDQAETTNLLFAIYYNYFYRFYKNNLLIYNYENVEKLIPDLSSSQYENLRQMIQIDIITNSIQYCNDLGAVAICVKNRNLREFGYILAKIADKSIQEFYETIADEKYKNIKKYMGYHDIDIETYINIKYLRSCDRFKEDLTRLSKFYLFNYRLYLSHKHGLRIIPMGIQNGKNLFFYANDNHTLGCYAKPEFKDVLDSIEVCDIIKNIFDKLYIPLIRKTFLEFLDFNGYSELPFKKSIDTERKLIPNPEIRFSVSNTHPWWKPKEESQEPFY
jgi:hypothetical protein